MVTPILAHMPSTDCHGQPASEPVYEEEWGEVGTDAFSGRPEGHVQQAGPAQETDGTDVCKVPD